MAFRPPALRENSGGSDMKTLIIVVALLASSMLLLSSSSAVAQTWRDIITEKTRQVVRPNKKKAIECYVSRHKYVWHGNKVVKVPVTTCEEKY